MLKGKIFTLSLSWIILTLCLYVTLPAHADNSCPLPIPSSPGNASFPENWRDTCESSTITWNDANSANDLARNSFRVLTIIEESGAGGPYTWSVSGSGFSLENTNPTGTSNTLYTDGTACGTATITVTGCNGTTEITGYVRCATGRWVITGSITSCPFSCTPPATCISNQYKCYCPNTGTVSPTNGHVSWGPVNFPASGPPYTYTLNNMGYYSTKAAAMAARDAMGLTFLSDANSRSELADYTGPCYWKAAACVDTSVSYPRPYYGFFYQQSGTACQAAGVDCEVYTWECE